MMIKQELVKKIKDYFNLNIYETKVWLALLSKGIASAGEIAEISGVPRSRTYDVLESLEKQGFAIAKVGKPTKYIVVKPTLILEKLKKKAMSKAEEKVKILEKLKDTQEYEELETLHNTSVAHVKKEEMSGMIKGKANIMNHIKELVDGVKKEMIICMPASELFERTRIFNNLFDRIKKQNVSVKLMLNGTNEELKKINQQYGLQPRKTDINSKFFIIDGNQVLFSLTDANTAEEELAVWINSPFFTTALGSLFKESFRK